MNLGMMLAGGAAGQGASNFVQGQAQGAFDQARLGQMQAQNDQSQKVWDFQNTQMDRTLQEQQIGDTATPGTNDADRLDQLADIAGKAGRGDLQRKYSQAAIQTRQGQALMGVANASRAITMGQFGPATQMLNQTGLFGQIHSIGLADDLKDDEGNPIPQDPNNPVYSVYTGGGAPDANGNPTPGPHVHVNQQMLYALQSNPQEALHWISWSQAMNQKNTTAQNKVDAQAAHWNDQSNHWQNQDASALQRAKATGNTSRLTDARWRYQWAQGQIGKPGGFTNDDEAMQWAMDPNRQNKDYWQAMKVGTDVAKANGQFSADDILKIAQAIRGPNAGTPATLPPAAPPPPPAKKAALGSAPVGLPNMSTLGKNPRFPQAAWSEQDQGWYQKVNGKPQKVE